jgi:hypothetical protein
MKFPILFAGQRWTATLASQMIQDQVFKAADLSRISTVTVANDPDLTLSGPAGTFNVGFKCIYTSAAAPGLRLAWGSTGTIVSGHRGCVGVTTGSAYLATQTRYRAIPAASITSIELGYTQSATEIAVAWEESPGMVFSTAWSITLKWAQVTSTATNLTLVAGSMGYAKQLA